MSRVEISEDAIAQRHGRPISASFVGGLLRLADLLIVGAIGLVIYLLYVYPLDASNSVQYIASIIVAMLTASVLFQWFGVYSGDYIFSRRLNVDRMLSAWAVTCCVLLAIAFTLKISSFYSRVWTLSWFVSSFGALTLCRLVIGPWIGGLAREGRFANRTVIVGAGEIGQRLAAHLISQKDIHTRVIGFVDDRRDRVPRNHLGLEVLGDTQHLINLIRSDQVDQVFLALPWSAESRVSDLVHRLTTTPVSIRLAPDLIGFELRDRAFTTISGLPMLHIMDRPISGWDQLVKTLEDRILASLLLIFIGPLLMMIAMAIKMDSPGPVFFKQRRFGFNNQLFEVWKFRTMHHHLEDSDATVSVTRDDPRVTGLGRVLRRSSLDELPQLFNVLKGEMSLVGPRPHAIETKAAGHACDQVVEAYAARHNVKPGITGWAQVNGWRGELTSIDKIQKRVEHDLYYIDNWSVWLDIKILFRTLYLVVGDDEAY